METRSEPPPTIYAEPMNLLLPQTTPSLLLAMIFGMLFKGLTLPSPYSKRSMLKSHIKSTSPTMMVWLLTLNQVYGLEIKFQKINSKSILSTKHMLTILLLTQCGPMQEPIKLHFGTGPKER
jgi:hypothetical protein